MPEAFRVPAGLEWWRRRQGGSAWLDSLPGIVADCADRWGFVPGEPFSGGNVSLALPVTRSGGSPAVLKVNFPEWETEFEADALIAWDGRGAVRLLEHDRPLRALLIERCLPGTPLWDVEDDAEATAIAARALQRAWCAPPPGHPFRSLADVAAEWGDHLQQNFAALGAPFERELLDVALAAIDELPRDPRSEAVLHQDLHGGNLLRAEREPWLVIDPKPLAGEREFDAASLLRDRRPQLTGESHPHVIERRLDIFAEVAGLDRERMRRWGIVHALAWGVDDDGVMDEMLHAARLLHAAR